MLTVCTWTKDPYINQALEEYVFSLPLEEDILYLWENDAAVVFGCYQNPYLEINLPYVWREQIAVVRRISGGGTVYHGPGNLNYTWITTPAYAGVRYEPFLGPVSEALRALGYGVEVRNACDIYLAGDKVSGSAQKRRTDRLLHHGTLLYDCDLAALKKSGPDRTRRIEGKGVPSRPAAVGNLSQAEPSVRPDRAAFRARLHDALGLAEAEPIRLPPEATAQIADAAATKYRAWPWTFGEAPWFRFGRTFDVSGITYDVAYEATHGRIETADVSVNGEPAPRLAAALRGTPLEPAALAAWLRAHLPGAALEHLI